MPRKVDKQKVVKEKIYSTLYLDSLVKYTHKCISVTEKILDLAYYHNIPVYILTNENADEIWTNIQIMGFGNMVKDVYECENQYDCIRHIMETDLPDYEFYDSDNKIVYFYGDKDISFERKRTTIQFEHDTEFLQDTIERGENIGALFFNWNCSDRFIYEGVV